MQISVIIPNYNHSEFLQQRINSVLNQTYQNIEIIILDDYSSDNSRDIISQYCHHPKVSHIVFNERNNGSAFKQWLKGIELAKGEWIWIAESDDWCECSFLQEMVDLISQHSDAVLAYCQSQVIHENLILRQTKSSFLKEYLYGKDWIAKYMLGVITLINASMAVFKKSTIQNVDKSFINYKQCGDWKLWCEIAKQGTVLVSGKYLNYFRQHSSNTTSAQWKEGYYYSEGREIFGQLIKEHNFSYNQIYNGMFKFLISFENDKHAFTTGRARELLKQLKSIQPEMAQKIQSSIIVRNNKNWIKSKIKKILP